MGKVGKTLNPPLGEVAVRIVATELGTKREGLPSGY